MPLLQCHPDTSSYVEAVVESLDISNDQSVHVTKYEPVLQPFDFAEHEPDNQPQQSFEFAIHEPIGPNARTNAMANFVPNFVPNVVPNPGPDGPG